VDGQAVLKLAGDQFTLVTLLIGFWFIRQVAAWIQSRMDMWLYNDASRTDQVMAIISQLLAYSGGDRVVIGLFHNGETFVNGWHYKKMSAAFEVTQPGISRISTRVRNVPLSNLLADFRHMRDADEFFAVVSDDVPSPDCRAHLDTIGVKTMLNRMIAWDGTDYGILSIQFVQSAPDQARIAEILGEKAIQKLSEQLRLIVANRRESAFIKFIQTFRAA
jgi:hypothetical protein